jgi:hypothetical protein
MRYRVSSCLACKYTQWNRVLRANLIWRSAAFSGGSGELSFSLEGLGEGTSYVLISNPNNGEFAFSSSITNERSFSYKVGALEVTAPSGVDGSILFNHRVGAIELLADGTSK